ncbi:MAG: LLM class flavin-dependent oxidoreductase [Chloroflexi bacterium]|nr:LLM class flavin-dependent oxidoreductase [Chloroflexota bacterium]
MPPILIGGDGEKYLLRAVAQHADWWLPYSRTKDVLQRKIDVLKEHCREVGREYEQIRKTYVMTVYLSRSRSEAERWAGAALDQEDPAFAGEPAALRDRLAELAEMGIDLFQLRLAGFPDTDDLKLFVDEVLPAFQ